VVGLVSGLVLYGSKRMIVKGFDQTFFPLFWVNFMEAQFVSHSMSAYAGYDHALLTALREGTIEPRGGKWKIGLSVNGCYRCLKHDYGTASFLFDLEAVRDRVKPTLYFPLTKYRWYEFDDFMVTWHNLAWETELCVLRGNAIALEEAKAIVLNTRRKKLLSLIKSLGIRHLRQMPYSPMHEWARTHLKCPQWKNEEKRVQLANQYNKWVAEWFDLDYDSIKQSLPELIEHKETERLGRTCRICKDYELQFRLGNKSERKCLRTGREVDSEDTCQKWSFDIDLFLRTSFLK